MALILSGERDMNEEKVGPDWLNELINNTYGNISDIS